MFFFCKHNTVHVEFPQSSKIVPVKNLSIAQSARLVRPISLALYGKSVDGEKVGVSESEEIG